MQIFLYFIVIAVGLNTMQINVEIHYIFAAAVVKVLTSSEHLSIEDSSIHR